MSKTVRAAILDLGWATEDVDRYMAALERQMRLQNGRAPLAGRAGASGSAGG